MRRSKLITFATGLSLLLGTTAVEAVAKRTTLKDVLERTLNTSPDIKADKAKTEADKEVVRQKQGQYFPSLDFRSGIGWEYTKNRFSTNNLNTTDTRTAHTTEFRHDPSLTLTQNIFDGMKTPTDVCKARSVQAQSQAKTEETMEIRAFDAINSALDVRRYQRLYEISKENVAEHKKILEKVNDLIDGGRATVADRHTVESRLHDAQSAVLDIKGDMEGAIASYIEIVGVAPGRIEMLNVPVQKLPKSESEALTYAVDSNYSVRLAKSSINVAKSDAQASIVPFLPDLKLEVEASRDQNTQGRRGHQLNGTAQLILSYNLFNGGTDAARQRETSRLVAEQRHRLEQVTRTAQKEIRTSWAEHMSAKAQKIDLQNSVKSKQEVLKVFRQQFDLGTRSLLDLLDAANEYFLAKGSLITIESTYDLTGYRMLASMGSLRETFGFATPRVCSIAAAKKKADMAKKKKAIKKESKMRLAKAGSKGMDIVTKRNTTRMAKATTTTGTKTGTTTTRMAKATPKWAKTTTTTTTAKA